MHIYIYYLSLSQTHTHTQNVVGLSATEFLVGQRDFITCEIENIPVTETISSQPSHNHLLFFTLERPEFVVIFFSSFLFLLFVCVSEILYMKHFHTKHSVFTAPDAHLHTSLSSTL